MISGCMNTQQGPKTIHEANVCGDGVCGATEDCNTCIKDCSCGSSQYCDSVGICKTPICGDEICSAIENQTQTCCEDCGCTSGSVCNKVTETCQKKLTLSDDDLRTIATEYMKINDINGTVTVIMDTYYRNQTVKQVNIDCKASGASYPCMVYIYVDNIGKVIGSVRSA